MSISASQILAPDYTATYKKKKTGFFFISMIWLFTCGLNTLRSYRQTGISDYSNLFWLFLFIVYILILLDFIWPKTVFTITDGQLIVTKRQLFKRSVQTFDISSMEQIEVEQTKSKPFLWFKSTIIDESIIIFFYGDKQITLGAELQKFNAPELFAAITGIKN
jgi:hypothetical protein